MARRLCLTYSGRFIYFVFPFRHPVLAIICFVRAVPKAFGARKCVSLFSFESVLTCTKSLCQSFWIQVLQVVLSFDSCPALNVTKLFRQTVNNCFRVHQSSASYRSNGQLCVEIIDLFIFVRYSNNSSAICKSWGAFKQTHPTLAASRRTLNFAHLVVNACAFHRGTVGNLARRGNKPEYKLPPLIKINLCTRKYCRKRAFA